MLILHDVPPHLLAQRYNEVTEEGNCSDDHLPSDLPDLISDDDDNSETEIDYGEPFGMFRLFLTGEPPSSNGRPMTSFDLLQSWLAIISTKTSDNSDNSDLDTLD